MSCSMYGEQERGGGKDVERGGKIYSCLYNALGLLPTSSPENNVDI